MTSLQPLLGLTTDQLVALAADLGQPAFRGKQLAKWLYERGARDFEAMTDLPKGLRAELAERYRVGRAPITGRHVAKDGTQKLLLELADGQRIETVALPWPDRVSVCVSSQTGCAIGCRFCATGYLGNGRNLTAGEMVDQMLAAGEALGRPATHAVLMGMGEPMANLHEVIAAVHLWRDQLGLSPRRVTISTVGLIHGIAKLAESDLPVTLAISLHSADDELRQQLIPTAARTHPVATVLAAARSYAETTGRRVTYEVVLMAGVNDRLHDAEVLARRLKRGEHVNLIPYNAVGEADFRAPYRDDVARFKQILEAAGLQVTQRQARGDDIAGACGQLRAKDDGAR
ncbi:MAG: 23S rRNA (adenine(2503)-C(2))-methyltransferase RlmN [Armatimonadetes bacterium]|nr:23S rRNA (adenine(2503)-C(2))-methyltransferase RlmN [Armatimonadota bacterium]